MFKRVFLLWLFLIFAATAAGGETGAATGTTIGAPEAPGAAAEVIDDGAGVLPQPAVYGNPATGEADTGEVVVLSADAAGCTFEVRIPEPAVITEEKEGRTWTRYRVPLFRPAGTPGTPEVLTRTFYVAVPPEADVNVAVERVSYDVRTGVRLMPTPTFVPITRKGDAVLKEVFTYDPQGYDAGPAPASFASLGKITTMRGYRVAAVEVSPYQYDPKKSALKLARTVVVRVSYPGGVRRPGGKYPRRPEKDDMDRPLASIILNYKAAREWPFAGAASPALGDAGTWPNAFAGKTAVKIVLDREGLYRLGYDDLRAAGVSVDAVDPRRLRLFVGPAKWLPRDFYYEPPSLTEVTMYVAGEGDGRFNEGDYVEFYGRGADYFEPSTNPTYGTLQYSKHRFTAYNVYWLVVDDQPGKRPAAAAVPPAGGTKATYYWFRVHVEQDQADAAEVNPEIQEDQEYYYWRPFYAPITDDLSKFTCAGVYSEGPKCKFQMMVHRVNVPENGPHHTKVYLNRVQNDRLIIDEKYLTAEEVYFRTEFPASYLKGDGTDTVFVEEVKEPNVQADDIWVDHFEVEYPRLYQAYRDALYFTNPPGATGKTLFEIDGFSNADVVVYDVTRGRRLTGYEVKPQGEGYAVRFTDEVPAGGCWYAAATDDAVKLNRPVDMYVDEGSRLRDFDENVDLIVVTYDKYYDSVQPLVNFRRSQGKRVLCAKVSDVYDEYSWGLFDPGAIRSFVKDVFTKAVYRQGGELPDALLLVGDAWRDYRDAEDRFVGEKLWRDFGRNQVPTYYVHNSTNGRAASDNYFVALNNGNSPDMAVGRFPAPFDENIDAIVEKVIAYERQPALGAWNSRVVIIADNEDMNEGGTGDFTYDNEQLETGFCPEGFDVVKENIEWLCRRFPDFDWKNRGQRTTDVANYLKPEFLRRFDALVLHYAGHGGPQVWAHETLYAHHKDPPPVEKNDVYLLRNGPRWPVVIQCSCSTAYFDEAPPSESYPPDYNQSITEYTLQAPGHGAVALMGSTRLGTEAGQNLFLQQFYAYCFPGRLLPLAPVAVGEAHFVAKVLSGDWNIINNYVLAGDPTTTLATPQPGLTVSLDKTSVKRGEKLRVTGSVPGNLGGRAIVQLFDRPWYYKSPDHSYGEDVFRDRCLTQVEVEVVNGRFTAELIVPVVPGTGAPGGGAASAAGPSNTAASLPTAEASDVAWDGKAYLKAVAYGTSFRQAYVLNDDVVVAVADRVESNDKQGPQVNVYLDDYSFRSGDNVGPTPELIVELSDPNGVLIARDLESIGEKETTFLPLTARVDNDNLIDLVYDYKPALGDYRAGSARRKLALSEGTHRITVTAFDNLGNRADRTVQCVVSGALVLVDVMNCPNPFERDTHFTFVSSTALDNLTIKIYTATGRLIQKIDAGSFPAGYNRVYWDGRDRDGDVVANGVYFYTLTARSGDQKITAREKLVKLR